MTKLNVIFLAFLLTTTAHATTTNKQQQQTIKNEPKTIGSMVCGDTPFGKFTADEYQGRDLNEDCAKVYKMDGKSFFFNENGQLFMYEESCTVGAGFKQLIAKHGEPHKSTKKGTEERESITSQWNGKDMLITASDAKFVRNNKIYSICSINYSCINITPPSGKMCFSKEQIVQSDNVVKLFAVMGIDLRVKYENTEELQNVIIENLKKAGLKPTRATTLGLEGYIAFVSASFDAKDATMVKKYVFNLVGDLSDDTSDGWSFKGKTHEIQMHTDPTDKNVFNLSIMFVK